MAIASLWFPCQATTPTTSYGQDYQYIQNNSLVASNIPHIYALIGDLAVFYEKEDTYTTNELKELVGANTLLSCLIHYESTWNREAVGDSGLAFSLLQFHRATFEEYSKKYGLYLEYENENHQILLAYLMLENPNNIKHWTTRKFCKRSN